MKYIVENWFVIVGLIAVCAAGGYAVYVFGKMPSDKQLNKVREWLLYAVTKAEKELGGGTGQIKLRYVYDMFVARFAWLARVISFEAFSMMVDEALERMSKIVAFFVQNARTIGIVYVVGAVVVFLAMTAFYIWVDRASKKEQELYYDEYYYPDDKFAERMSVVVWFILSLGCAILWVGIPLLICGLIVYTELEEHCPELMGDMTDRNTEEFDKEENK